MTTTICFYKEVDQSALAVIWRLKIGVCAVIRSNMVVYVFWVVKLCLLVFQDVMARLRQKKIFQEDIISNQMIGLYLKKCTLLCMLIITQLPPIHINLDVKKGDVFDVYVFKRYIHGGQRIKMLVWPPLYVRVNGQLLAKGVAEGDGL